ncbi:hypothetical protein BDL97_02G142000 [Sphagnum fallax]|jgi:hypothetical protein|nr:hypothetical protein BDL97_02G142000 [Sphagnum fallax]
MWVSERVMMGVLEKSPRNRSSCHLQQFLEARASRTKGLNGRVHANTSAHGVEPMDKFVPVEHPSEPLEADKPTWCPRPEPCIMHDGRIWKERITAKLPQKAELLGDTSPFTTRPKRQHRYHKQ